MIRIEFYYQSHMVWGFESIDVPREEDEVTVHGDGIWEINRVTWDYSLAPDCVVVIVDVEPLTHTAEEVARELEARND